jgi:hypothetical protein
MAANPTFKKREKERARQERQREKDAKRKQRREEKKNRPEGATGDGFDASGEFDTSGGVDGADGSIAPAADVAESGSELERKEGV